MARNEDREGEQVAQRAPFRIARRHILGLRRKRDAIGLDEVGEDVLVAALLEGVKLGRLLQQRVADQVGIALDPEAGAAFVWTAMSQMGRLTSRPQASSDSVGQSMTESL
jgi:hypothetical protein